MRALRSVMVTCPACPDCINVSTFALVETPKYPVPLVNLLGVRISSLYASWNLMTALMVAGPKRLVSSPFEPGPEGATRKGGGCPELVCSEPVEPVEGMKVLKKI